MKLFINDNGEIKDVNTTSDSELIMVEVDDENNPFLGWSVTKICCYKVKVEDGIITMLAPYIDSRIIEHIDKLGMIDEANTSDITDIQLAMTEIYEMMLGGVSNG